MTGFWINLLVGIGIAAALFGAMIFVVVWLFGLSMGRRPRLPVADVSSVQGIALLVLFAGALAGAGLYFWGVARSDWAFWDAYTLPKHQVIDYVLAGLLMMPSLYWFGYSAVGGGDAGEDSGDAGDYAGDDSDEAPADDSDAGPEASTEAT